MGERDLQERAPPCIPLAVMMDALPTKTSAKVPMNSATKWRRESRMGEISEVG